MIMTTSITRPLSPQKTFWNLRTTLCVSGVS